jgi:peptidoglycan/LPS O-acetylase OafA/YrhL
VTAGPASSGWLPSIEGVRAVAVGLVLCSHLTGTQGFISSSAATYQALGPLGNLGVRVFFVLSGFLITQLLLREEAATGRISLKRFWARRALRIFPAFYVFLIAVAILGPLTGRPIPGSDLATSAAYLTNWDRDRVWLIGHTWSLGVEEQFYLLWPIAFLALAPSRRWLFAGAMFLLGPTSRLITWRLFPEWQLMIGEIFPTVMDALATGVLLALLRTTLHSIPAYLGALGSRWCALLPFAVLGLNALGSEVTIFRWALGSTLANVGIALLIDRAIAFPHTPSGRFLNLPVIRYLGRISYSFYLWQQFFLDRSHHAWYTSFPVNLALAGLAAAASYHLVERPILRLRDRFRAVPA